MGPFETHVQSQLFEKLALKGSYKGGIYQRLVAAKYRLAPTQEPRAVEAFLDLVGKIQRQSEFLSSKFDFQSTSDDPYGSMRQMSQDIERQRQAGVDRPVIPVYAEPPAMGGEPTAGHPVLSNEQNVTQRGVHDVIAHFFGQHPFSARGEYAAYNRHLKTLCNRDQAKSGQCLAAKAMFTEVVAQTSYFYVYGKFANQKAVILEDFDHYYVGRLSRRSPLNRWFEVRGKLMQPTSRFTWEEFSRAEPKLSRELLRQQSANSRAPLKPIGDEPL